MRRMRQTSAIATIAIVVGAASCSGRGAAPEATPMKSERTKYVEVALTSDLYASLTVKERAMVPLLIDACREMDSIFWRESYGDRAALFASITDPELRRFAEINYGPWDRLSANAPFLPGVGEKPKGAGYYPTDMTAAEFEAAATSDHELKSPYTIVRRDPQRKLVPVPFHEAFPDEVRRAAGQVAALRRLGCRIGQGFYFAKPLASRTILGFAAISSCARTRCSTTATSPAISRGWT